jgi:hypothetical protein
VKIIKKPLSILIGKTVGELGEEIKECIRETRPDNNKPLYIVTFSTTPIISTSGYTLEAIKVRYLGSVHVDSILVLNAWFWKKVARKYGK